MSDTPRRVDAVNTAEDGDDVVVYLRVSGEWQAVVMSKFDAVTLADMLRLNTRTTD